MTNSNLESRDTFLQKSCRGKECVVVMLKKEEEKWTFIEICIIVQFRLVMERRHAVFLH